MAVPPEPVQLSEKVLRAVSGPMDSEPLLARFPVQPPLAVQPLALLADQVSEVPAPESMRESAALKVTVGAGAALTATVWLRHHNSWRLAD